MKDKEEQKDEAKSLMSLFFNGFKNITPKADIIAVKSGAF
jgi:hypothetical protein